MTFSSSLFALALVLSLAQLNPVQAAQASVVPAKGTKAPLVRVSIINMSGKLREAHVRGSVVSLPVAKAVVLQVHVGECVRVQSSTDSRVSEEMIVSAGDEGRVLPVR